MDAKLPDKRYMKIGEVSRLTSLKSSVLRFWETEFDQLQPQKSRSGQRLYSHDDLELIFKIRHLLYREKLTIAGARSRIEHSPAKSGSELLQSDSANDILALVKEVRQDLLRLRELLE